MEFSGKAALVSGGGSGIGFACARRLLAAGANVTIFGRTESKLAAACGRLAEDAPDGATVDYAVADVTDESAVRRVVTASAAKAPLRAVVHSAGQGWAAPIAALDLAAWRLVVEVNMTGCFLLIKHAAPVLSQSGGGAITAISSINGMLPARFLAAYSAAKAGLDMLVKAAANELGPAGIRVNSVLPGLVPTELNQDVEALSDIHRDFLEQMPLGRAGAPEEVAEAVYFLSSDRASWITGVNLPVDGGHHLRRAQDFDAWIRKEHPQRPAWWGVKPGSGD